MSSLLPSGKDFDHLPATAANLGLPHFACAAGLAFLSAAHHYRLVLLSSAVS